MEATLTYCGDDLVVTYASSMWRTTNGQQFDTARKAMRAELEAYLLACGEDLSDMADEIESALDGIRSADEVAGLADADLAEMSAVLTSHGDRFAGNSAGDQAEDWLDHDFTPEEADAWCEIGVWDAGVAAELRGAGLTPDRVAAAAESLTDGMDDPAEEYTDGDPIYAACNGDISVQTLIDAAS